MKNSIYTYPICDKELRHIRLEAHSNLSKRLKKGSFGERWFKNTIPPQYIRKMALIIAYSAKEHEYDKSQIEQLLKMVFESLKAHPNDSIKKDAGRAMCDIHKCVKLYLETNFHPEAYSQSQPSVLQKHQTRPVKAQTLTSKQIKQREQIEQFKRKHQHITSIPTLYSNGFNSLYREQMRSRMFQDDSYEYGLSDID